jgi:hypothetical protein
MKKMFLILAGLLFISAFSNGQYSINKTKYNYHTYSYQNGDPYKPALAGVESYLLPGLGQMTSGEVRRGLAFLGGSVGSTVIFTAGVVNLAKAFTGSDVGGDGTAGFVLMPIGLIGALVIDIWSIVDAIHVAEVNNLAFRDKNKTTLNFQIRPYLSSANSHLKGKPATGISFMINF